VLTVPREVAAHNSASDAHGLVIDVIATLDPAGLVATIEMQVTARLDALDVGVARFARELARFTPAVATAVGARPRNTLPDGLDLLAFDTDDLVDLLAFARRGEWTSNGGINV
jgi:hypothetical protein